MIDVVILGSTGSIGTQAIEVVRNNPDRFRVIGLSAGGTHIEQLADQIRILWPTQVAVPDEDSAARLTQALGRTPSGLMVGREASSELAQIGADVVLNAITGYAGLEPTLATLGAGSRLALANKESMVVGGQLITSVAKPGQIVPIDSEHSALAQALRCGQAREIRSLILTASGGPFHGRSREQLRDVSVDEALAHPTWSMGRVVTINSATMVNKGLELIEAKWLFGVSWDRIKVVVHPQSIVHSMVEFIDGSTIAQCSPPDMRLPIGLALAWPDRLQDTVTPCDWSQSTAWTFEPVDSKTFPAIELARWVGQLGHCVPAVFNAANEVCVDRFCLGKIGFLDIVDTVAAVVRTYVETHLGSDPNQEVTLNDIRNADTWARQTTNNRLEVAS